MMILNLLITIGRKIASMDSKKYKRLGFLYN